MGYLNDKTGYRKDVLSTRSIVRKENFVLLTPDGLVKNVIPGYQNCTVTILGSPSLGASFADYLVHVGENGKNNRLGGDGIETFLYVIDGAVTVRNGDSEAELAKEGYFYSPAGQALSFENKNAESAVLFIYKRRYEPLEGYAAQTTVGSVENMAWLPYEGMDNCHIKDLLPAAQQLGFDMNFHILKFKPGGSHGYIETHIQEHGMYFLSGKGMYRVDDEWIPVEAGEYMFLDAYCPQACYGVGDEDFMYLYSKDCNRDVIL